MNELNHTSHTIQNEDVLLMSSSIPEQKATAALGEMAVDVVDPNRPEEPKDTEQAQV